MSNHNTSATPPHEVGSCAQADATLMQYADALRHDTEEIERLTRERTLLAEAMGAFITRHGIANWPMTGPELLAHFDTVTQALERDLEGLQKMVGAAVNMLPEDQREAVVAALQTIVAGE